MKLGVAEAAAACTQAAHDTKGWQVKLAEPNRIVVKSLSGLISYRTYPIEIVLAEALKPGNHPHPHRLDRGQRPRHEEAGQRRDG